MEISHLQYADDTIIFRPDKIEILSRWWDILNLFMAGSGLSLNLSKSSLIGINVDLKVVDQCAVIFGCKFEKLPITLASSSL